MKPPARYGRNATGRLLRRLPFAFSPYARSPFGVRGSGVPSALPSVGLTGIVLYPTGSIKLPTNRRGMPSLRSGNLRGARVPPAPSLRGTGSRWSPDPLRFVALVPPCAPRRGSVSSLPLLDVRSSGFVCWRAVACTCVLVSLCLRGFAPYPSGAGVGRGSPPAPSFAWGSPRPHALCPLATLAPSLAVGLRDSGITGGLRSLPAVGRSARLILFALPSVGLSFPVPSSLPSVAAMGCDPSFGMGPSMRPPCGRSGWRVGWVRFAPTLSLLSAGEPPSVRASLMPCGVLSIVPYLRLRAPPLATLAGYCGRFAPTKMYKRC